MAKVPLFRDGVPLFKDGVPLFGDPGDPCCCGGDQCYIPKKCSDDTDATFGIPTSLVLRKPMYFKLAGGDGTVYYIPADATPTTCPEDVETAIVEVQDCDGHLPICCAMFSWHPDTCKCMYSLAWIEFEKKVLDNQTPGTYWDGAVAAYNAMSNQLLPTISWDGGHTGGPHTQCEIGIWERYSDTWTYGGDIYRLHAWLDDNELHVDVQIGTPIDWDPITGDPIDWSWGDVPGGDSLLRSTAEGTQTCCTRTFTAWYDGTSGSEYEGTWTAQIKNNQCCTSSLVGGLGGADNYDSTHTYASGDLVIDTDGTNLYVWGSLQNSNTNHTPRTNPTWWQKLYPYPCVVLDADDCPLGLSCEDLEF